MLSEIFQGRYMAGLYMTQIRNKLIPVTASKLREHGLLIDRQTDKQRERQACRQIDEGEREREREGEREGGREVKEGGIKTKCR